MVDRAMAAMAAMAAGAGVAEGPTAAAAAASEKAFPRAAAAAASEKAFPTDETNTRCMLAGIMRAKTTSVTFSVETLVAASASGALSLPLSGADAIVAMTSSIG
jgi:hypothetical protein